jgi:hypothetical protein
MTDETREQIKRDAHDWGTNRTVCEDFEANPYSFMQGAENQHPIAFEAGRKAGFNDCLCDMIASKKIMLDREERDRSGYEEDSENWDWHDKNMYWIQREIDQLESMRKV